MLPTDLALHLAMFDAQFTARAPEPARQPEQVPMAARPQTASLNQWFALRNMFGCPVSDEDTSTHEGDFARVGQLTHSGNYGTVANGNGDISAQSRESVTSSSPPSSSARSTPAPRPIQFRNGFPNIPKKRRKKKVLLPHPQQQQHASSSRVVLEDMPQGPSRSGLASGRSKRRRSGDDDHDAASRAPKTQRLEDQPAKDGELWCHHCTFTGTPTDVWEHFKEANPEVAATPIEEVVSCGWLQCGFKAYSHIVLQHWRDTHKANPSKEGICEICRANAAEEEAAGGEEVAGEPAHQENQKPTKNSFKHIDRHVATHWRAPEYYFWCEPGRHWKSNASSNRDKERHFAICVDKCMREHITLA